jgi:transcription antitermination factor NusA-like protein
MKNISDFYIAIMEIQSPEIADSAIHVEKVERPFFSLF